MVGGVMPVCAIVLLFGFLLAVVIFFTSSYDQPPKYHYAFAFVAFATAILAIYTITNEIVNILPTFGTSFKISKAMLALTFLAWANCVGGEYSYFDDDAKVLCLIIPVSSSSDIMSNTILAKNDFPRIAFSACFGGPVFSLLIGIGIPMIIMTLKHDYTFEVKRQKCD